MPESVGVWFGLLNQSQKEEVLKNVSQLAAERFKVYKKTIHDATGLTQPKGQARLQAYRNRQPQTWQQLSQQFPQEYNRQMQDFGKLEQTQIQQEANKIDKPELGQIGVQAGYALPLPSQPELGE